MPKYKVEVDDSIVMDLSSSMVDALGDYFYSPRLKNNRRELRKWMYGKEGKRAYRGAISYPDKMKRRLRKFYSFYY